MKTFAFIITAICPVLLHPMFGTAYTVRYAAINDTSKAVRTAKVAGRAPSKTTEAKPSLPGNSNLKFYHSYTREIDLKVPQNLVLCTPGNSLFAALLKGIRQQKLTAYDDLTTPQNVNDEPFGKKLTAAQALAKANNTVTVDKFDADGNRIGTKKVVDPYNPDNLAAYRIKEVVYLNKQTKKVETQIIGIAPLTIVRLSNGDSVGVQPVCWLKYKQCLPLMASLNVPAINKNLPDVNIGDFFTKRAFAAKVTQESNPKDLRIIDYIADPVERDKEAARIEKRLADYKNNPGN
ncbi:hypothetical protein [uncultured Mucilaginibacter sp.]|uniref:hypothetical protein n=1 Tax=uncultured Mucilaginibacter sp. TaxID=797541 RepID=UPI0025D9C4E6|nr:hypothetical protein [uncultured Mucilaginibacter sp.]